MRFSLLWLLCAWLAAPVSADWLVSRDGQRLETRGAWRIKQSVVVFKLANGSLSSLRLADVDLEASARATADATRFDLPASPAEPVKRYPVLVLTTEDVGRAKELSEPADEEMAVESNALEMAELPPVQVISWRQAENPEIAGLEIHGTLRNDTPAIVTSAGVQVSLFDNEGELIARREAFLDTLSIAGRATIGFRALFPRVESFEGEPAFDVRARELVLEAVGEDRESD